MILIKISLINELMSMTDDHPLLVFVQNSLVALFLYRRSVNTIVCLLIVTRGRDSEGQGALIEVRIILTKNFTFLFQTSVNTIILRLFIYHWTKISQNQRIFENKLYTPLSWFIFFLEIYGIYAHLDCHNIRSFIDLRAWPIFMKRYFKIISLSNFSK